MKKFLSLVLATTLLVTPVFKPANMSFLNNIRQAGQSLGHSVGSQIPVNVDVSDIINRKLTVHPITYSINF